MCLQCREEKKTSAAPHNYCFFLNFSSDATRRFCAHRVMQLGRHYVSIFLKIKFPYLFGIYLYILERRVCVCFGW